MCVLAWKPSVLEFVRGVSFILLPQYKFNILCVLCSGFFALCFQELFCSHIFTYRFVPHRFKNQQCGCVVTGQSISAAPANVTTTTVKQKCLNGRSPRNGTMGKHYCTVTIMALTLDQWINDKAVKNIKTWLKISQSLICNVFLSQCLW